MECKVSSVEYGVWSVNCGVWSARSRIPSETHGMIMSQSAMPEHLLTRGERHVLVASPIDTPTLHPHDGRAHTFTQNDMSTSSDMWRKIHFAPFPIDTATSPARRSRTHIPSETH